MPKRPPPGQCVHCLTHTESLTWDHGIPVSWYPDGPSGEKIKAPSCRPCQDRLAKIERAVLLPLGLSLDPNDPLTRGIPQAIMRSLDPEQAAKPGMTDDEIAREKRARNKLREEVRARIFEPDSPRGAFPGFGPEAHGGSSAMKGPHVAEIGALGEKFTRVAVWAMRNSQFIIRDRKVKTHVVNIDDVPDVEQLIRKGEASDAFPGVRVTIRTAADDPRGHLCLFELWARFKLITSVTPDSVETTPPGREGA